MRLVRTKKLPVEQPMPKLPAGPGPKWRVKLDAAIYAPAAIQDGVAYVGTTGGVFSAVAAATGKIIWTFSAGRPMFGEPLATDSAVYFTCENGWLFKLDRLTGKEVWRYDLGDSRTNRILPHETVYDYDFKGTHPIIANGLIFVGSGDSSFHAVNAATGKRVWRIATTDKVRTNAIMAGQDLIFGDMSGMMYVLDPATGKERWHKDTHSGFVTSPALIDGRIIVALYHGFIAALTPDSGKVLWRMGLWSSGTWSDAVNDDGLILIGSSDMQAVSVVDTKTGRLIWRTDLFGWAWSRVAIAGDIVFEGTASGKPYYMHHEAGFAALDRKTGKILWRWPMPEWPGAYTNGFAGGAAIAGDLAIIGGLDGTLYAFPVTEK
jgi:outer membrane protein assembly factor BamB